MKSTVLIPLLVLAVSSVRAEISPAGSVISPQGPGTPGLQFIPTTPCRVVDTRNANGSLGGPIMNAGTVRNFTLPIGTCGIPSSARAYSLNVTVIPTHALNYLTIWATSQPMPPVSTINSDGRVKANSAIVAAGSGGAVSVYVSDQTQVVLDIDGYFVASGTTSALAFYPLEPCRVVDTRQADGPLAGPSLTGGKSRVFPILSSSCGIPETAQAYSLNFTALPKRPLAYLTTWPTGQGQPSVSTLNAPTGTVVANAAIVPPGQSGAITVFVTDNSDLVIDVDGYFAAPGIGGLSLRTINPCRALDSRNPPGSLPLNGFYVVHTPGTTCGLPNSVSAYVLNATVVPPGPLQWLTLWPDGTSQPSASVLNAYDGAVTSNMTIVPTTNGSIDAYMSDQTFLILDIDGYFAP